MQRIKQYNAILSVLILLCLVVGWTKPFSFDLNVLIYNRLFFILVGISFFLQTKMVPYTQKILYVMYAAIACCVIGAFLPLESSFTNLKTIGLFAGIIITFFNRPKAA
ncbi:MAG: hypothetical protein JSS94_02380 [Bacteroidetes bacterium]|nr:hypothetical protein [Bacteroidota bacterium]